MRLAVLVSGTGSILEAMLGAGLAVDLVGADRLCRGLQIAADAGIDTALAARDEWTTSDIAAAAGTSPIGRPAASPASGEAGQPVGTAATGESTRQQGHRTLRRQFDREGYSRDLAAVLSERDIDVVAMAGFGTVLHESFFEWEDGRFAGRVLNTHPSLLPAFPGWHAVRDALEAGAAESGCTVHVAIPEVDAGPILAQQAVPVLPGDDEATLHERIKAVERDLYPATISAFLDELTAAPSR